MTQTLYRNFIARWFGNINRIVISDVGLTLIDVNQNAKVINIDQFTDFPQIKASLFSKNLIINTKAGESRIWGINARCAKRYQNDVQLNLHKNIADKITSQIDYFHQEAISQYLRDSSVKELNKSVTPIIQNYRAETERWQKILTKQQCSKIDIISRMPDIKDAQSFRQYYEGKRLAQQAEFFDGIEANPLTTEQRLAVIRNNDKNLILAAAGTGKTSVMVAKALSLISFDNVPAENVLVLAYNNAAAKELKERLVVRKNAYGLTCQLPTIMTFHALGLYILKAVKANTRLSEFTENQKKLETWFTDWLITYISQSPKTLKRFIDLAYQPLDAVDLSAASKGATRVRDNAAKTLPADVKASIEQLLTELVTIDNTELIRKRTAEIVEILKSSGLLAENSKRYIKCLQAIRVAQLDSKQVETRLNNAKVINAKQYAQLLDDISQAYSAELKNQKAIDFDDMINNAFVQVSSGIFKPKWTDILVDEFQDISVARMDLLNALIDKGPRPKLTVVGDDWQSIYRFSGGTLALITQFEKHHGSHSLTTLQKTFRYNNSIAKTAGQFVMQNPEQYNKQIQTHHQVAESQVYLLDSDKKAIDERIAQVVNSIRLNDATGSIAILARYRYLLDNAKTNIAAVAITKKEAKDKNIHYWTFHGAKGLEADYGIIVGFFQGKTGFPNESKADALVEALLPLDDGYKHSEERRLLYVAITRAKRKVYLIADAKAPSSFIEELLAASYDLKVMSKQFNKRDDDKVKQQTPVKECRKCGRAMKQKKGQYGDFWGCSGFAEQNNQCSHTEKADMAI
ncbi:UvrD-helicase domain-containing protein [Colwellia piezophila]|uniref:UvrD-helicase domain-containing protein n=1 Tax=Colwellia piezophila TaxID=211668 RepID=UPI0003699B02|nr:UvrD-helicase domain-containing protein [Colwellia piezophila]